MCVCVMNETPLLAIARAKFTLGTRPVQLWLLGRINVAMPSTVTGINAHSSGLL